MAYGFKCSKILILNFFLEVIYLCLSDSTSPTEIRYSVLAPERSVFPPFDDPPQSFKKNIPHYAFLECVFFVNHSVFQCTGILQTGNHISYVDRLTLRLVCFFWYVSLSSF